jgi:hypothetical protein
MSKHNKGIFRAAALSALLAAPVALPAAPASAQAPAAVQRYGEKDKDKTWGEMEREKAAERAYKRSLGNVPEKGPVDPWGNARSVEAPKGDAKAAAKADAKTAPAPAKVKTGDTAK